jgi:hypothetical protein
MRYNLLQCILAKFKSKNKVKTDYLDFSISYKSNSFENKSYNFEAHWRVVLMVYDIQLCVEIKKIDGFAKKSKT